MIRGIGCGLQTLRTDLWDVRLANPDRGGVEDIWYVGMPPRWHITTGPAAILWDPAKAADGNFRIESEIYLFDTVRFSVNGAVVASLPRGQVLTDGTVGFRVNHSVNIHITTLDVTSRIP